MRAVEMVWRGVTYTIPANRAFAVGEEIEDIAPISVIASWGVHPRWRKLARCYGIMLRHAGAKVADETILESITPIDGVDKNDAAIATKALIDLLLAGAKPATESDGPPKKDTAS